MKRFLSHGRLMCGRRIGVCAWAGPTARGGVWELWRRMGIGVGVFLGFGMILGVGQDGGRPRSEMELLRQKLRDTPEWRQLTVAVEKEDEGAALKLFGSRPELFRVHAMQHADRVHLQESSIDYAIRFGWTNLLGRMFEAGWDINRSDVADSRNEWNPPMYRALEVGRLDVAHWLLAKGASISATNRYGISLLEKVLGVQDSMWDLGASHFSSGKSWSTGAGQFLIREGADVFAPSQMSGFGKEVTLVEVILRRAMFEAAEAANGWVALKTREERGPNWRELFLEIATTNRFRGRRTLAGETLLHLAARGLQVTAVRRLVEAGVDLEATNQAGRTAIMELAMLPEVGGDLKMTPTSPSGRESYGGGGFRNSGELRREVFQVLSAAGAKCDLGVKLGMGDLACLEGKSSDELRTWKRGTNGWGLVHFATLGDQPRVIRELAAKGVDLDQPDSDGNSPIQLALAEYRTGCVMELAKHCRLEATNRLGWTPLSSALAARHFPAVEALVSRGARLNAGDRRGLSPVAIAYSVAAVDVETLAYLAARGLDLNGRGSNGMTLLHCAVLHADPKAAFFLTGQGLSINAADDLGRTPMHLHVGRLFFDEVSLETEGNWVFKLATSSNALGRVIRKLPLGSALSGAMVAPGTKTVSLLRLLMELGADVNARDREGNTPMHYLEMIPLFNHSGETTLAVKTWFEMKGVDVNARNVRGESPLFRLIRASGFMHLETVQFLLKNGARWNEKDVDGVLLEDAFRARWAGRMEPHDLDALIGDWRRMATPEK